MEEEFIQFAFDEVLEDLPFVYHRKRKFDED